MSRMPTTRWSLVLKAAAESPDIAHAAVASLCEIYREPVLRFFTLEAGGARAEDLTQSLFASFVERSDFARADRNRGRFRDYLLGAAKHLLANSLRSERTRKEVPLVVEDPVEGSRLVREPADGMTPEDAYHAAWVRGTVALALQSLGADYEQRGAGSELPLLLPFLAPDGREPPYAEIAERVGKRVGAIKMDVFRLRQRFQERLHEVVAATTADEEIDDELRVLSSLRQRWSL